MLHIPGTHVEGQFIEKLNRFVALVDTGSATVRAHVPTSSRMQELLLPGARVVLADHRMREGRATGYSLIMTYAEDELISVDSGVPNRLLEVYLRNRALAEFAGWNFLRREVRLGDSRLDFLLERDGRHCWIEAKSVTLVREGTALFPDAPTTRGVRHLGELAAACEAGDRAAAVFIIQRSDAVSFSPNRALDADFALALQDAMRRGVEVYAYACRIAPDAITIEHPVAVVP